MFAFFIGNGLAADQAVIFDIEKGDGFHVIARHLKNRGLIKSETWFKIYSLITGTAHLFKPGRYSLVSGSGIKEIIRTLVKGPEDITATIQEGETLIDVDRKLSSLGIIGEGDLIRLNKSREKSLEGFLFPDTYRFARDTSVEKVVNKITSNFRGKLGDLISDDERGYQNLIIASLIEKEAPHPQDRVLVSGIIQKRLQIGMPLQVDATVVYAKCQGAFLSCDGRTRNLSKQDLKMKNPYNSYLYKNLPPTPIANPGKEAVLAALYPQKSDYLYYISNPQNGRIVFSPSLDGHNQNKLKYLR